MASRFWVGGTGNWDAATTTNWAATSGGAGGQSVPTSADTVTFDSNSGASTTTCTITATANCSTLTCNGSMTVNATAQTLTSAGAMTFGGATFSLGTGTLNGTTFTQTGGTIDLGSGTVTCTTFDITSVASVKVLTLGTATINCTQWTAGNPFIDLGKMTFSGASSTINTTTSQFNGASLTYGTVNFTAQAFNIVGYNTFTNLTWTGTAAKTNTLTFAHDQVISGTLTINGNSATNRVIVSSSVSGNKIKLTVGTTVTVQNADFMDIEGAGAASWNISACTGNSGDCQGNTGITFTTPVDQHWVGGGGDLNWSTVANWTSRVPLPQDNVFMDYAFGTSQTIVSDMPRMGKTLDWTGATWTTALTYTSTIAQRLFGGWIGISGVTYTSNASALTFLGRGSFSLCSNGLTIQQPITVTAFGGTYTLTGNFTMGVTRTLSWNNGTLDTGVYVLSVGLLNIGAGTGSYPVVVNFNTGTHLITGTGSCLTINASRYITMPTTAYTLKVTDTANVALTVSISSVKVSNIWFDRGASTNTITVDSTNAGIFGDLKDTGTAAHQLIFGVGKAFGFDTFTVSGSATKLITIKSSGAGQTTILLCKTGTINCDYISCQDTLVSGGATWNAGANSNFTSGGNHFSTSFGWADAPTSGATSKYRYWVAGGSGLWTNTNNWSLTSGGASGASVPNGHMVYFDSNSGSGTVTVDTFSAYVGDIDCTGFAGNFATASGSHFLSISGNIKFSSSSLWTNYIVTSNKTICMPSGCAKTVDWQGHNAGVLFQGLAKELTEAGFTNDTYTFQSSLSTKLSNSVFSGLGVVVNGGTINANGYNLTMNDFVSTNSGLSRGITMGSGTWTVTGSGTVWGVAGANMTVTPGTSTIKLAASVATAKAFSGGGMTYYNIVFDKSASTTISDSNTFNDISIDESLPATITLTSGTTTSFNTFSVTGRAGNTFLHTFSASNMAYLRPLTGSFSVDYIVPSNISVIGVGYMGTHSNIVLTVKNLFNTVPSTVVAGQVTNSGTSVSGAVVRLVRQEDNMEVGTTVSDGSGNYSFYADSSKLYHVFVEYTSGGTKYNAKSLWNLTPV